MSYETATYKEEKMRGELVKEIKTTDDMKLLVKVCAILLANVLVEVIGLRRDLAKEENNV